MHLWSASRYVLETCHDRLATSTPCLTSFPTMARSIGSFAPLSSTTLSMPPAELLRGIRVVSMAQNVPGPLAVARLAARGASATKIEAPSGDPLLTLSRSWYDEMHRDVDVERV